MKVTEFEITEQRPSGELQANVALEFNNTTDQRIYLVNYNAIFLDSGGFPLESGFGSSKCELKPGDSTREEVSANIPPLMPVVDAGGINVRATATLFTMERIVLGEVEVPVTLTEPALLHKEIACSTIGSPLRVAVIRTADEDGTQRVECRLTVKNTSTMPLEFALQTEFFDADGDEIESSQSPVENVPAMSAVPFVDYSRGLSKSEWRKATLKIAAIVYSPVVTVECVSPALSFKTAEDSEEVNEEDSDFEYSDFRNENTREYSDFEESELESASESESEESDIDGTANDFDEDVDEESEEDVEEEDCDPVGLDQKVRRVLTAANATEYASAFAENEITADVLSSLSDADLAAMGIAALGARKRILAAISADVEHRSQRGLRSAPPVSISADTRELPRSAVASTDWHQVTAAFSQQFLPHGSVVLAPDASYKKLTGARGYATQLGSSGRVLMLYDDTLFRSAKDGITVSDLGVHWKNQFDSPGFTPWSLLPVATAAGKSVGIQPGASANVAFGGAQCATVIACFINAACGAFMASMPLQVHPQFEELQSALAWMLQRGENRTVTLKDPDAIVRLLFKVREGRPVLAIFRPALESAEGFRVSALIQQLGKFRAYTSDGGRDWFDREYATIELGFAAQHAFLILRALHLKPDGATVHIERSGA
jgi:hypothetical protein